MFRTFSIQKQVKFGFALLLMAPGILVSSQAESSWVGLILLQACTKDTPGLTVSGCEYEPQILETTTELLDDWAGFVDFQDSEGFELNSDLLECLENRLKTGSVECQPNHHVRCLAGNIGFATSGFSAANVCARFETRMEDCSDTDLKGTYIALIMHEFTHSCGYLSEEMPEWVEDAVLEWFDNRSYSFDSICSLE